MEILNVMKFFMLFSVILLVLIFNVIIILCLIFFVMKGVKYRFMKL